jgi:hypothetical protein
MNHSQVLLKLSAPKMVEAMQEDISRLVINAMISKKNAGADEWLKRVLPPLKIRWNQVLNGSKEISADYTSKAWVVLSVLLHKYGLIDKSIIKKAELAMDALNKGLVLSDDFARQTERIKQFLRRTPEPLKRNPTQPKSITFYRAGDVISFELKEKYYAGYIHRITGNTEAPEVEWYDVKLDHVPSLTELKKATAKGRKYNDGITRISTFALYGLKSNPDPAHQVQLIGSGIAPPSNAHLQTGIGMALFDIFRMQIILEEMFM